MIGYITVGTNDLPRAAKFYDALLGSLGGKRFMESDRFIAWSAGEGSPLFSVCKPFDEKDASIGNGCMTALAASGPEQVKNLYGQALELGATDEGEPGPRAGGAFFCAYVRDLDGNKLNLFCPGG